MADAACHPHHSATGRAAHSTPQEVAALEGLEAEYKLAIPPYYFSLIDLRDPHDPIRLQSVPSRWRRSAPSEGTNSKTRSKRTRTRPSRA